jgi:hypothetical protein
LNDVAFDGIGISRIREKEQRIDRLLSGFKWSGFVHKK